MNYVLDRNNLIKLVIGAAVLSTAIVAVFVGYKKYQPIIIPPDIEYTELIHRFAGEDTFLISDVEIKGASEDLASKISLYLTKKLSEVNLQALNLDLNSIHLWLLQEPLIAGAKVSIGKSGVLQVRVNERLPQILWFDGIKYSLLDGDGVVLASNLDRDSYPAYFVVSGEGANEKISEVIQLTQVSSEISHMIRGFVRVGKRRWDIILDHNRKVKLPENDPVEALVRLRTIHSSNQILKREISIIDLRIPQRTYARFSREE